MRIIIVILLCASFLNAQRTSIERNHRFTLNTNILKNNEKQVTRSFPPETDIRIAVNPKDESNLIQISIQHRLNNREDSYIMPIFYTNDGGISWNRSIFRLLPELEYNSIVEVNDPMIDFTSDGTAVLSWAVKYIRQELPGIDSIYHQLLIAYSKDGGESWKSPNPNYLASIGDTRQINQSNQGINTQYKNIDLLNIDNKPHLFYSTHKLVGGNSSTLNLVALDNNFKEVSRVVNNPFQEYIFADDFDIVEDDIIKMVFTGFDSALKIIYAELYSQNLKIKKLEDVSTFNFFGSFKVPLAIPDFITGLNPVYFSPSPKLLIKNDTNHIVWQGSGIGRQTFQVDAYYCKGINSEYTQPLVLGDSIGYQFNPEIETDSNNIFISFYNRPKIDSDSTDLNLIKIEPNNNFEPPIRLNYRTSDHSLSGIRNFNYGIGQNKGLLINRNHLVQSICDLRDSNGNIEVYTIILPLDVELSEFINKTDINFSIKGPKFEGQNYTFYIDSDISLQNRLFISDALGKVLYESKNHNLLVGSNSFTFNFSLYPSGTYYLICINQSGIYTKSIPIIK